MAIYRKNMKRKTYKKKTGGKAKVSAAVKTYVKHQMVKVKPEVKRNIDYYTEQSIDAITTPYQYFEFLLNQGTGTASRVGISVKLIGLAIRAQIRNNTTTTQLVRTLVLSCASDTDTAIATMELFKDANVAGTPTTLAFSGTAATNTLYRINDAKFKVHHDHTWKLAGAGSTDAKDVMLFKKFIKFNTTIKYDANQFGLGNQSRRFFVLYITSDPLLDSGGGAMEISGINNWYFTDC